jgi:transcriptional regulator with XRE-family HTH domain
MTRAAIHPELLTWARERAGKNPEDLDHRFPKLALWEAGDAQPTIKQLQAFADAVHVPVGYLFPSCSAPGAIAYPGLSHN